LRGFTSKGLDLYTLGWGSAALTAAALWPIMTGYVLVNFGLAPGAQLLLPHRLRSKDTFRRKSHCF
jgi:hypothetical protein